MNTLKAPLQLGNGPKAMNWVAQRFANDIKKFGMDVKNVYHNPGVKSVSYHNHHLFTIPTVMFMRSIKDYKDKFSGHIHPSYFDLIKKAMKYDYSIRNNGYIRKYEKLRETT